MERRERGEGGGWRRMKEGVEGRDKEKRRMRKKRRRKKSMSYSTSQI